MILGRLQTRNYEWVTITETTDQALENLKASWESHREESGAWLTWDDVSEDVWLEPFNLGDTHTTCHRCENLAHN